eukprot:2024295-Rhodomonas_salina.2
MARSRGRVHYCHQPGPVPTLPSKAKSNNPQSPSCSSLESAFHCGVCTPCDTTPDILFFWTPRVPPVCETRVKREQCPAVCFLCTKHPAHGSNATTFLAHCTRKRWFLVVSPRFVRGVACADAHAVGAGHCRSVRLLRLQSFHALQALLRPSRQRGQVLIASPRRSCQVLDYPGYPHVYLPFRPEFLKSRFYFGHRVDTVKTLSIDGVRVKLTSNPFIPVLRFLSIDAVRVLRQGAV